MGDIRGVIPILKTPFDLDDRVDEESLRREVDHCVDAGAHGLGIAFGSEIPKLSEVERTLVARVVIEQARGRIPVVMSTGYPATVLAVRASQEAEALGASAVMLIPPANGLSEAELHGYFRTVAAAVDIPIVLQVMTGAHLSGDELAALARAVPQIQYAKVESAPPAESVAEAIASAGDRVTIIGGASGSALIEELEVGSQGTMPHAALVGSFARIWDLWHAGKREAARETWQREIAPLNAIGGAVYKEMLRREGVIAHSHFRAPAESHLDTDALCKLDRLCETLGIG
ncbi:MAG: dihydrodipicolinate synthase family protein [Chloroflexi bacterium]|nr:dihydrodipicolinate synthase family protein [Chloroflexota bacterium]MCY4111766.1 dihydrodipicolinate synthase family protein [Chloroflexota bacterium]